MSLNLTTMRSMVRQGLGGLDSSDLPDPEVDRYLNLSFWELENTYPFKEKECLVTTTLVAGQEEYEIPSDLDALRSLSVVDDDKTFKLKRMGWDHYDENRNEKEAARARPEWYLRRDNAIVLMPIPDDAYTLRALVYKNLAALVEGSVETPDLPRNWHELVVEGAIARGHYYRQDYNLAQQSTSLTLGKIRSAVPTESKEETDSRYARLNVIRELPDGRE